MNNRPFFSTNTNVYDQSVFSSAPTNFNGQNVLISQEQQRKMCDTFNTSIMGLPYDNLHQMSSYPGNFIQAQRQFIPGGVLFTFNVPPLAQSPQLQCMPQQVSCCPPAQNNYFPTTLEQQVAASGLQKHGLESMQYQQQLAANPFQLKFHFDTGTSCSDLLYGGTQIPGSRSTPDYSNFGGVLQIQNYLRQQNSRQCKKLESIENQLLSADAQFPLPPVDFSRNIKKLTLSKPPNKFEGHVVDLVDIQSDSTKLDEIKKRVYFADESQEEKKRSEAQNNFECNKPVSKKAKTKRKIFKKKDKELDTESSEEEDSYRTQKKKSKKSNKKNKGNISNHKLFFSKDTKYSDSHYGSTEDSE